MRISYIRINKDIFIKNLTKLRRAAGKAELIAIVKANAYGHGIKQIASLLRLHKVQYLGVAYPSEAFTLRDAGDLGKIIIIVPPSEDDGKLLTDLDLEFVIDNLKRLEAFNSLAKKKGITLSAHLFINTGMNRDGIAPDQAVHFMKEASKLSNINLIGICTQFADSETIESDLANAQINRFNMTIHELKKNGFTFKMKHICNTGGVINYPSAVNTHVRTGIGLYGYADEKHIADKIGLQPCLSLVTEILTLRNIKKGENVGYSKQFIAQHDMKVAVLPIGYGDGYSKLFTNKGKVIHNQKLLPIIGSVCMDQFMIDVTDANNPNVGDQVTLLGTDGDQNLSAYELANTLGTIPYEILTSLNSRLERKYQ